MWQRLLELVVLAGGSWQHLPQGMQHAGEAGLSHAGNREALVMLPERALGLLNWSSVIRRLPLALAVPNQDLLLADAGNFVVSGEWAHFFQQSSACVCAGAALSKSKICTAGLSVFSWSSTVYDVFLHCCGHSNCVSKSHKGCYFPPAFPTRTQCCGMEACPAAQEVAASLK